MRNAADMTKTVALYEHTKYGWLDIKEIEEHDSEPKMEMGDYVRISEPMVINFNPIEEANIANHAVKIIDKAMQDLMAATEYDLKELREKKQNYLSLSYQPAEDS